jgi:3-dehydroquinate synthetase
MVDSSVGGKVGVDLPEGKNLVGAFKQPDLVLIDPQVLSTLPDVEWRNGMAEVLKHGLIADDRLLEPSIHTPENAATLVEHAVRVKVDVVQRDPYEKGERAHLNLGHTFGHALEQVTQYAIPHWQAVAIGLHAAAELSIRLGLCSESVREQTINALVNTGLPYQLDELGIEVEAEKLWSAMKTDKKWKGGLSRFVLLRNVGEPCIIEDVAKDDVLAVLRHLGAK